MANDWGKVFIARRYEVFSPSDASECYTELVAQGLRQGDRRDREFSKTMHAAANALARKFLKTDCDTICYIDSDAVFTPDTLEIMRSDPEGWEYDVLQAFTVKRGYPPQPMYLVEFPDQPSVVSFKGHHFVTQLPIDPHFIYPGRDSNERIAVSLHFTLIRRSVFERIMEADKTPPEFTYWFEYSRDQGEDVTFSVNAQDVGAKLAMTTKVKVGHGSYVVSGWDTMIEYYTNKFRHESGEPAPSAKGLEAYFLARKSLAELVSEYTGEDWNSIMLRSDTACMLIADRWRESPPTTQEQVRAFYGETREYLYDLVRWNASPSFQKLLQRVAHVKGERVLEIGGGLGTVTEYLATHGNTVDYYEVPGILRDFAVWRFSQLGSYAENIQVVERWEMEVFDRVIALDVIEHVHPDQVATLLDGLALALKPGGVLFAHNTWENPQGIYPQHFDNSKAWAEFVERHGLRPISEFEWLKPVAAPSSHNPAHPDSDQPKGTES